PAFHKLFLETEWLADSRSLLCRRRPRSADQQAVCAIHVLAAGDHLTGEGEYESDRARFLGRRGTPAGPHALRKGGRLSGPTGPVLDPIFSIRCRVVVPAGGRATVCFTTGFASTQETATALAARYHRLAAVERAFELAWAHSRVELKHFHLSIR